MKTLSLLTLEQAQALCALMMVSDPSPLDSKQDELANKALDSIARSFGVGTWVDLYHADPAKWESCETLTEATQLSGLMDAVCETWAESQKAVTQAVESRRNAAKLAREVLAKGVDTAKFEVASSVLYVSHFDQKICRLSAAKKDIANGFKWLKRGYYGAKHYDRWSYQDSDHDYRYGPSHGRIVSEIGLKPDARERDITPEETEACLYALEWPYEYAAWLKSKVAVAK